MLSRFLFIVWWYSTFFFLAHGTEFLVRNQRFAQGLQVHYSDSDANADGKHGGHGESTSSANASTDNNVDGSIRVHASSKSKTVTTIAGGGGSASASASSKSKATFNLGAIQAPGISDIRTGSQDPDSMSGCRVPSASDHRSFCESGCGDCSGSCAVPSGSWMVGGQSLKVQCEQNYALSDSDQGQASATEVACLGSNWIPEVPLCLKLCPPLESEWVVPKCKLGSSDVDCSRPMLPGTTVRYHCRANHIEYPDLAQEGVYRRTITCMRNGMWSYALPECKPEGDRVAAANDTGKLFGCLSPSKEELASQHRVFCKFDCEDCESAGCLIPVTSRLAAGQSAKVQCEPGYGFSGQQSSVVVGCSVDTWTPEIPQCLKLCPPLESEWVVPKCKLGSSDVDCSRPMLPGTTVRYHCRASHIEYPDLAQAGVYRRTITCRRNGKWSNLLPECQPVCGVSNFTVTPQIVDGNETNPSEFPWHTSIYHKRIGKDGGPFWDNVCGGSLVSKRLVLTAAHCLPTTPTATDDMRVAFGKKYRNWSIPEEFAVKRNVSQIFVPDDYKGASFTFMWDIAILVLDEEVTVNSFIMPVCLDLESPLFATDDSITAYVVGFGKTTPNGKESETLLQNDLYVLNDKVCRKQLPKISLLGVDKFCGAMGSSSVAEKGDSGGGVTTLSPDGLHYIRGIVSVKYNSQVALFTNITWNVHKSWLEGIIDLF